MSRTLLYAFICLLTIQLAAAVTINSVTVNPANATTDATLSCIVNATDTVAIAANITWYKNGVPHNLDNETITLLSDVENSTSSTGNIEPAKTTKGDVWICQVTVYNNTDAVLQNSSSTIIINSPPTIVFPTNPQTISEHQNVSQTATAYDPDGDPIVTFISSDLNASQYGGNELFTITSGGAINFLPTDPMNGNHTIAILAFDGQGWGGANILYEVIPVNDPPYFNPTPTNRTAYVGQSFSITITGEDEENDPLNFTMNSTRPSSIIMVQNTNTSVNITFTTGKPGVADEGLQQVTVVVYDPNNASLNSIANFYINVTIPNTAPVLTALSNQTTGTQGQQFTFLINASDVDVNDTLLFSTSSTCALTNPWDITTLDNTSTNATGIINLTLTNDNVVCRNVTITVRDYRNDVARGGVASLNYFFNITNVNDLPIIYNISYDNRNLFNQENITNLTAPTFTEFVYEVNATDPDMLTYAGDSIRFTSNSPVFTINSTSGEIRFTPTIGQVGNYLITITATDQSNASFNTTMNLTVDYETYPSITPIGTISCPEKSSCVYDFTAFTNNTNDDLTFTFNDSLVQVTKLSWNTSELNTTYINNQVGNYSIIATVTDSFLHQNSTLFNLSITNVNDQPIFDNNKDEVRDTLSMPSPVVINYGIYWLINVTDLDFRNAPENLTFTSNITTGPNTGLFSITKVNTSQALIQFTPSPSDTGDYSVNISVYDLAGESDTQIVNFSIINATLPPAITAAQPFNNGSGQISGALTLTNLKTTTVAFPENTTINFNFSYADPDTPLAYMSIWYYINGQQVYAGSGSNTAYSKYFDFFSAGTYNVTAIVQDDTLNKDNFTWHLTITNVNRPPVLLSAIPNRTINQTASLSNEMAHFIDPDNDLNSNNVIDGNETSTMTYTMSYSSYITARFTGRDVTLTPILSGVTTVYYNATDSGGLVTPSNNVTYIVFFNPEQQPTPTGGGSGGGGGGGGSTVITIPIKEPDPYALDILVPKSITIYENDTVIAPLAIVNTGQIDLQDIKLTARTDGGQNVSMSFLSDTIKLLHTNETYNTSLAITNYKYQGTFQVYVTASVGTPKFNDSAVLYINSVEKGSEGSAVNVKITYARDLLTANPACGELLQLVDQAQQAINRGDTQSAEKMLKAVSDGCVYLRSQAAKQMQAPTLLETLAGYQYTNVFLGAMLFVLLIIGGLLIAHYARQE